MLPEFFKPIHIEKALREEALPQRYIRGLAIADLYFALQEVGEDTRREVLALATPEQVQGILDLDLWQSATLDLQRLRGWFHSLFLAVPESRLRVQIGKIDDELLIALILTECQVMPTGHEFETGAPEREADWQSPDGKFWLWRRTRVVSADAELATRLLDILYREDPARAYSLLLEASVGLLTEIEETAYQFRDARLADMGFPPADVASSIWSPKAPRLVSVEISPDVPYPRYAAARVAERWSLHAYYQSLSSDTQLRLAQELTTLANAVVMTEALPINDRTALERALGMVTGFLDLGFALQKPSPGVPVNLQDLFRLGVGRIAPMGRRARSLLREGVFDRWQRPLTLLRSGEANFLRTLARPHPLFSDPRLPDGRAIPFLREEHLAVAEQTLDRLEKAAGFLLRSVGVASQTQAWEAEELFPPREERTIHTLLGTILARIVLKQKVSVEPISRRDVAVLLKHRNHLEEFRSGLERIDAWLREEAAAWIEDLRGAGDKPELVTAVLWHP